MTALSDYLSEHREGQTIDTIAAKAAAAGHAIDRATVSKYLNGKGAKNPPDDVLKALASGMGLDVRKLRTLAGQPPGEQDPYRPPAFADRLNRDQRKALDELIRTIVEGGVEHARSAPTKDAGSPGDEVAKRRKRQYPAASKKAARTRTD